MDANGSGQKRPTRRAGDNWALDVAPDGTVMKKMTRGTGVLVRREDVDGRDRGRPDKTAVELGPLARRLGARETLHQLAAS